MVIHPYDLVRGLFKGTTILLFEYGTVSLCQLESKALLKEKPQCELNVAFDSKVTRSCDKIIDIIKLEATLGT